ncbi:PEP-utilizing enzyme, partial [Klebsiella pneumoniae]|uniref:PEP-utilizing enzyme n=1 Tax=Klebsiella pneumoniae TaxID=573 RepID=UPI0035B3F660
FVLQARLLVVKLQQRARMNANHTVDDKFQPRQTDAFVRQAGDVLVTDMTDPDWEPIMKKASAIVTNRGGRTCHAAIIARELG